MIATLTMPAAALERTAGDRTVMDEARFHAVYQRTARRLRSYLAHSTGDRTLADDLLQDTYLRFLGADFASDDPAAERAYLFRIATNLVRDHYRRGRRELPSELPEIAVADTTESRVQMRADVAAALSEIGLRDRQMLWLAYVEGASHDEIGPLLGLRPSSLKSMLSRARARFAARLGERGFGGRRQ